jgi:hypothetical protein
MPAALRVQHQVTQTPSLLSTPIMNPNAEEKKVAKDMKALEVCEAICH